MKRIWIIGLFLLCANWIWAHGFQGGKPRETTSSILIEKAEHNRPSWTELGLEDLLVAGEESSVTAPPIQTRLASRTQTGQCSARGPVSDANGHLSEPYRTTVHQSPNCLSRRVRRPIDYFVYFIAVLRL